jgi:16S rRNA (guanine966-N2)-methyltransferase
MLGEVVIDARVMDLFAGSGALGLEALSRGATECHFIDDQRSACEVIRTNLAKARLEGAHVRPGDVQKTLLEMARIQPGSVDLVFADPPYQHERQARNWAQEILGSEPLRQLLAAHGSVILECSADGQVLVDATVWQVVRDKVYGGTRVLWLRRAQTHADG